MKPKSKETPLGGRKIVSNPRLELALATLRSFKEYSYEHLDFSRGVSIL